METEEEKVAEKGDNEFKRGVAFKKEKGEEYENKGVNDIKCGSSNTPDTLLKNRRLPLPHQVTKQKTRPGTSG